MFRKRYRIFKILAFIFLITVCLRAVANQTNKAATGRGVYVDEEITAPVTKIAAPETKKAESQSINFNSPTLAEDLKNYLENNIDMPKGYILSFSFSYDKTGTIADIHLISVLDKDFTVDYPSRIYGDVCKRDKLAEDQIYVTDNSTTGDLRVESMNNTKDGKYLVKIYDLIKNIGKSHIIEIPPEKDAEFIHTGGMYYGGKVYISQ